MRGDPYKGHESFAAWFQFTPLREGRHAERQLKSHMTRFQFTPLREGRLLGCVMFGEYAMFQFTPLREGRLEGPLEDYFDFEVSIHAPA